MQPGSLSLLEPVFLSAVVCWPSSTAEGPTQWLLGPKPGMWWAWLHARRTSIGLGLGAVMLVPILVLIGAVLRGFALDPVTPVTLVWVVLALFVVGTLASVVPATRALRVDPVAVLKTT